VSEAILQEIIQVEKEAARLEEESKKQAREIVAEAKKQAAELLEKSISEGEPSPLIF
jgi:regulator of protease activity HflC (stomatin/prohibitin superfamily)